MKPVSNLAKDNYRDLEPCVHGADVLEAAKQSGLKPEGILDFSSSVNPYGPSEKTFQAIKSSFGQIASYPDSCAYNLRFAIASHYNGVSVSNISVGNGSTELIYLFADAFLRKGDVAVVPAPSFGEYENAVRKTGQIIKRVRLDKSFHVDPSVFEKAMTKRAKVVYLCNPNNPTSILASPETIEKIVKRAIEKDILVFLDEDFLEFVENGERYSLIGRINEFPNLFVLRSFTKIFGLAGLRIGYGIASEEITDILMNAKIPWNVNCLGQTAAIAALNDEEHLKKTLVLIEREKAFLLSELAQIKSLKVYPPDANFLFINIKKTGLTAAQLRNKMLDQGILIRDCTSFFGIDEYYIRVAIKTRKENEKMLAALKESLLKLD